MATRTQLTFDRVLLIIWNVKKKLNTFGQSHHSAQDQAVDGQPELFKLYADFSTRVGTWTCSTWPAHRPILAFWKCSIIVLLACHCFFQTELIKHTWHVNPDSHRGEARDWRRGEEKHPKYTPNTAGSPLWSCWSSGLAWEMDQQRVATGPIAASFRVLLIDLLTWFFN